MIRPRRPWRRLAGRAFVLLVLLALTATLAAALHIREVRVTGCRRFPAREVEHVLRSALGTPTVAARPDDLRAAVRGVRWVSDAQVRVSLDGIVSCAVEERVPVAVAEDVGERALLDVSGKILGPAAGDAPALTLAGFAPYPDERAMVLAAVPRLEEAWGGRLIAARRLGPADVALTFADTAFPVLADPGAPECLAAARRVAAAWMASVGAPPMRLDARVRDRVLVLPAAPPPEEEAP